jgi:8-oxo-dGTP pyrophosphatase MutT (NUDIX family)
VQRGSPETRILDLSRGLTRLEPRLAPEEDLAIGADPGRASVALVLRPSGDTLELLLIKRATRADDPWSGHIALPGGRSGPADADAKATAERETWEEVGIDLPARGTLLGRLDDVQPSSGGPRILVSAFVYSVPPETEAVWNHEVDVAIWVSLEHLAAPTSVTEYLHPVGSDRLRFPALRYDDHLIWGITFRIVKQLLGLLDIGDTESPSRRNTLEHE